MADRMNEEEIDVMEEEAPEEGAEETPAGETMGLGEIVVTPDMISGIADKKAGDTLGLTVQATISDIDENGNVTISLDSADMSEPVGGASDMAEAMVTGEEEPVAEEEVIEEEE